jgi:hypothetical protein
MFNVDAMDNEETAGVAFGQLAGEFIRTKVVPEVDAVRFAQYAGTANIGTATGNITDGAWYAAVSAAMAAMDDAEVPAEERYLFITPAGLKDIEDMDTTKSKACLASFAKITKVPQSRFYTKVKLNDSGAGGYSRDDNGKNLNFLIVAKSAVLQTVKHEAPKVITPEQNQDADAWKFGYRIYGLNDVYENKVAGIYAHIVSSNP